MKSSPSEDCTYHVAWLVLNRIGKLPNMVPGGCTCPAPGLSVAQNLTSGTGDRGLLSHIEYIDGSLHLERSILPRLEEKVSLGAPEFYTRVLVTQPSNELELESIE